jgi:hypothetical protein
VRREWATGTGSLRKSGEAISCENREGEILLMLTTVQPNHLARCKRDNKGTPLARCPCDQKTDDDVSNGTGTGIVPVELLAWLPKVLLGPIVAVAGGSGGHANV